MFTYKIGRKYGEWCVVCLKDGKRHEPRCYYTEDWEDALGTLMVMVERSPRLIPISECNRLAKALPACVARLHGTPGRVRFAHVYYGIVHEEIEAFEAGRDSCIKTQDQYMRCVRYLDKCREVDPWASDRYVMAMQQESLPPMSECLMSPPPVSWTD